MSYNAAMGKHRSDAAVRRLLILDAADAIFSEYGVTAPLDLVVERAGVGRATLYRNFPDRTALIEALVERNLQALEEAAQALAGADNALFLLFERIAHDIADSPAMVDFWRTLARDNVFIVAARKRLVETFRAPLQRAIAAGLCRPDLSLPDISLLTGMLGASLRGSSPAERRALARRALRLLEGGLRAPSRPESAASTES